jgi:hypothetical protein
MIKYGQEYVEIGAENYEKAYEDRKVKAMTKTLKAMGYECQIVNKKTGLIVS